MTDAEGNEIGKLFVGGLSQATNNASLRLYFSRFGEVDDAVVMMDNKTGRSRGFGYVKFRESESVTLALEAKPHILDGKEVDAKQCNVNMKGRNRRSLKIFVGGIGLDQDVDSIKHYFKQFGRVTDVNLMMDSNKQRHRGFAFVGFEDEAVVKRLIGLHYVTMNNKQVEIKAMEPPNFGRKVLQAPCVTTTTVLGASPSGDATCTHAYDTTADPGTLIPGGLNSLNSTGNYSAHHHHHPYLSPQTPTLQCAQHNLLSQARANPSMAFEPQHHANYGGAMLADTLYPSTAYLQPLSPTQHSLRTPAETILPTGSTTAAFGAGKQPVPFILSNGQLHQTNGLIGFPPNAASVYTTFPCQLVPPTPFVPSHHNATGAVGTLVSAEKSPLGGWTTNNLHAATHLTLCPPQIGTQPGLLSCSQFNPNVPTPVGAPNPSMQPTGQHGPSASGTSSMLAPYYAVCTPYTTIHLQPDQSGSAAPFTLGPATHNTTGIIGNGLATCGIPTSSQSVVGDTAILPLQTAASAAANVSSSRPNSPTTAEMKSDATNGKSSNYPTTTVLMSTANASGYPSGAMMPSTSSSVNLGQALWNHSPTNMVYSSVPVGWGFSSSNQSTSGPSWHSTLPVIPQQQQQHQQQTQTSKSPNLTQSTLKLNGSVGSGRRLTNECSATSKEISVDSNTVASAKASGDSLDGLMATNEHGTAYSRPEINTDASYHCGGKPQSDSVVAANDTSRSGDKVTELTTWPVGAGNVANDHSNSGNSVALPSWNSKTGNPPSGNATRWTELPHGAVTNMTSYPHPWNLPIELMDDNLTTNYEASVARTNSFNSVSARRSNNIGLSHLNRTGSTNFSCPNGLLNKNSSTETVKSDQISNGLLCNNNYTRLSQRMSTYNHSTSAQPTGQHSPSIQAHPNNSGSSERLHGNLDENSSSASSLTSSDLGTSRTATTTNYGSWLYANNTTNGHLETSTGGDGKEMQSPTTIGVELECQGPAGAAGDYHRPVQTGHFSSYHLTH